MFTKVQHTHTSYTMLTATSTNKQAINRERETIEPCPERRKGGKEVS